MSSKSVDAEINRYAKVHPDSSEAKRVGTPGGYRGRSRSRTGTASLYTHLMMRNPREGMPRALRWLRAPVAMREDMKEAGK